MKTIAITIGTELLERLDRLASSNGTGTANRSLAVRTAVREFMEREERQAEERHEAATFKKNRSRLARQAEALVKDQARI